MDKIIGEKLKKLRKENGFTIVTLGKELDVSIGIISEWEHGRKHPRPGIREKLCGLYGVKESEVFGNTSPPPRKKKTPPVAPQVEPEKKEDFVRSLEEVRVKKQEVRSEKKEKKETPLSGFFKKFFK